MDSLERIELLLNRCGQTIMEPVDHTEAETTGVMMMTMFELIAEYLQCVHIIDRMETALENVCGERDYLRYWMRQDWVKQGICERCPKGVDYRYKGYSCAFCDYMEDGVPEDWSVGDE